MAETPSYGIHSWKLDHVDTDISVASDTKYILDNHSFSSPLETCVYHIARTLLEKKLMVFDETKHCVEFYGLRYSQYKLDIEYRKKEKKSPLVSGMLCLKETSNHLLFTPLNNEQYKYKEIPDENQLIISFSQKNKLVSFDSSLYFGPYGSMDETDAHDYLVVNIWDIMVNHDVNRSGSDDKGSFGEFSFTEMESRVYEKKTADMNLMEQLLYHYEDKLTKIQSLLLRDDEIQTLRPSFDEVHIRNNINCHFDKEYLIQKYGNVIEPFFPFINNFEEVHENNILNNNNILQKALSLDVCYWIINECEKHNQWAKSNYVNYPNFLNVELLPAVFSLVKYLLNFWLLQIRQMYQFEKVIDIKITDVFITKYTQSLYTETKQTDETLFSINIPLNDRVDYIRGDIVFDEGEHIYLDQGDMIVFNGKRNRTKGEVTYGVKYVLVVLIDLAL